MKEYVDESYPASLTGGTGCADAGENSSTPTGGDCWEAVGRKRNGSQRKNLAIDSGPHKRPAMGIENGSRSGSLTTVSVKLEPEVITRQTR